MTVSTTTNKVSYIGNGIATTFAIPFPFLEKEHLKVYQLLNDIQTERADWSISGGNMVFATAPADGVQIVIMREVPLTQETDYRENEILPAETLERNFDKLTMQVQQLKEQADRAVTVDIFDGTDAASLIPSIRQSVSDAAAYAATAADKAEIATDKALIAANKATEASHSLSAKADKDFSNCTKPYVTEQYCANDSWYRIWNNGWKECGGVAICNSNANYALFNFPVVFTSIPCVFSALKTGGAAFTYNNPPTTSNVTVGAGVWEYAGTLNAAGANGSQISVYACGY